MGLGLGLRMARRSRGVGPRLCHPIRRALVYLLELVLHFCFIFACVCISMHLPKSRRHRSGQVYRTRPLVKSYLCVALFCNAFAMQKCSPVVNSRWKASVYRKPIPILAVKWVCTGNPFQLFVRFAHYARKEK